MAKTAYINARVESKLKKDAEDVLEQVGVNTSELVTMVLKQVVLQQGIPFDVCTRSHTPNAATRRALRESRDPKKRAQLKTYTSTDEMFTDILGRNWRKGS